MALAAEAEDPKPASFWPRRQSVDIAAMAGKPVRAPGKTVISKV